MRKLTCPVAAVLWLAAAVGAPAQTVLDRVLSTVNGEVVTALDVRQARMLKLRLVTAPAESDADILRGLENRRLVLAEVSHVTLPPPGAGALAQRRREWEASLGEHGDLGPLLDRAGLSQDGLSAWLRDDVRVAAYLDQRFGGVRPEERPAEIQRWLGTLREHAGLPRGGSVRPTD